MSQTQSVEMFQPRQALATTAEAAVARAAQEVQPAASDGDLGPQKPQEAPEPPKATNTPEAPKESPEATVKRQCKALKTLLGMKGHDEVQLMRFLAAEKGLDDSLGTLSELGKVAPQMLGQIHDTFGKIEVELKAWKEAAVKV